MFKIITLDESRDFFVKIVTGFTINNPHPFNLESPDILQYLKADDSSLDAEDSDTKKCYDKTCFVKKTSPHDKRNFWKERGLLFTQDENMRPIKFEICTCRGMGLSLSAEKNHQLRMFYSFFSLSDPDFPEKITLEGKEDILQGICYGIMINQDLSASEFDNRYLAMSLPKNYYVKIDDSIKRRRMR